ncbi:MAG: methyltransferase domain-containing protein [Acidobacteria bacterium]|nr:methyltransferase domain-containing protein [Acidobacteriota bacterium]MCL5286821.1 methyltransferase domain-containing protein [Acidobacteriota bacterium]
MRNSANEYIPALKYNRLTAFYDPLIRWALREDTFKKRLIEQAGIQAGQHVLDLGCGTATLTLLVKRNYPASAVTGLDGDPNILRIAAAKIAQTGLDIRLDCGMSFDLPYASESFDRVLSSLMLHHLTRANRVRTLLDVLRVLQPGGELHIADWGKPQNAWMRAAFCLVQILDGFETTADSAKGLLPELMREAGFEDVQQTDQFATVLGTLCLYRARKPGVKV